MTVIILGKGAIDQQAVEPRCLVVGMAEALTGIDEAGHRSIMNSALRMGIERQVVMPTAQPPQEPQAIEGAGLREVLLVNKVEVGIAFEQIAGASPPDQRVDLRGGEIGAQFVN